MKNSGKALKNEYKLNPPAMGVFQIRNLTNDKVFIAAGVNLQGIINRHRFELKSGGHKNKALQADWNEYGADNFAFEILDELKPKDDPNFDHKSELALLEALWLENTQPYGENGYNEKKKSRQEMLDEIMRKRTETEDT